MMDHTHLPGFGEEVKELKFNGFLDWFVKFNDPLVLWHAQPTYILVQAVYLMGATANLVHALKHGGRLPYLWLATLLHGLVVEAVTYNLDDIDNFWHSQTPVVFLGRRLPLHIISLYPVFIYHASIAVSRMHLPKWAEPFAVGLVVVLIDIPYDIVSVKFLHWSWHDTDPNIGDRHYWVPWNSYYFHACFAASFTFWFHGWHHWLTHTKKWQCSSGATEMVFALLTAILGMPGGVLFFLPLYHPLHDLANIHSEVTFFIILTIFLLIIWSADRLPKSSDILHRGMPDTASRPMLVHLVVHYALFLGMVVLGEPEHEISIGLHEKTGPCNETVAIHTAFGTILQKRRFLCVRDYDEQYFDFHCLPDGKSPSDGMAWYTACGTPFTNRMEYFVILSTICILAAVVFWNLYSKPSQSVKIKKKRH